MFNQTQQFSFGPQPIFRVNQPCFRVQTQPMQSKKIKSPFQKGYDIQEQNKLLKQYIGQMEQTLKDLQLNNKKALLNNQLKENSLLREEINNLQKELRVIVIRLQLNQQQDAQLCTKSKNLLNLLLNQTVRSIKEDLFVLKRVYMKKITINYHQTTYNLNRYHFQLTNWDKSILVINIASVLILKNNRIRSLIGIKDYNKLNYLDISNNHISDIVEICQLELKVLIISSNKLRQLSNLPNSLKILDAQNNQISKVDLKQNKQLKSINLSKNKINEINLSGLVKLVKLNLDENNFKIFTEIPILPMIQTISAQHNQISKLFNTKDLEKMPQIKHLIFLNNPATLLIMQKNYLDYLIDIQVPQQQTIAVRNRCKSVESQQPLKYDVSDIVMREKSIPKLNVLDFNTNTPLPQQQSSKQTFNQFMLSKMLQKQFDAGYQHYRTEIQVVKQQKVINQLTIRPAQLNYHQDSKFLKKVERKTKSEVFSRSEIERIYRIKEKFYGQQSISDCVIRYYEQSKCLLCYGNIKYLEQLDIQSLIIKYCDISQIDQCNLFQLNSITQLTLKYNNINYLDQIIKFKKLCPKLTEFIIEKNPISESTLLRPFINQLYTFFDQDDKKQFYQYFQLRKDCNFEEQWIPDLDYSLTGNLFDFQFDKYIFMIYNQLI